MRKRHRRLVWAALLTTGVTFQVYVPNGCGQFALEYAVQALDSCAIVNCNSSAFFDFCAPVRLLDDCPTAP